MQYLKTAGRIISDMFFGVMLIAGLLLIILKIGGFSILAVETGSMGAELPVGSLIIVDSSQPENIRVGDVISFVLNEDLVTVTHRVIDIDEDKRKFYTKGDANNIADVNPVAFENLIGKVRFHLPYVGYAVIWSHTTGGKAVIALAFVFIALCTASGKYLKSVKEADK
jgi:signal peptidase